MLPPEVVAEIGAALLAGDPVRVVCRRRKHSPKLVTAIRDKLGLRPAKGGGKVGAKKISPEPLHDAG